MITHKELIDNLDYNRFTGIFTWKKSVNHIQLGEQAGTSYRGYRLIRVNGRKYSAHKLAWFYETGKYPKKAMDHINGIRDDNRIINLREASNVDNARNHKRSKRNTSGVVGVHFDKRVNRWYSTISNYVDGVSHKVFLGSFKSFDTAVIARKIGEKVFGYHENHGRVMS